jgi:hypothetical protein
VPAGSSHAPFRGRTSSRIAARTDARLCRLLLSIGIAISALQAVAADRGAHWIVASILEVLLSARNGSRFVGRFHPMIALDPGDSKRRRLAPTALNHRLLMLAGMSR